MGAVTVNKLGEIRISNEVLATLAGISAISCYGIVGMASKRATDGLVELLAVTTFQGELRSQLRETR